MSCILRVSAASRSFLEINAHSLLVPYRVEETDDGYVHAHYEICADVEDPSDYMSKLATQVQQNIAQISGMTSLPGVLAELDIMVGLEEAAVMKSVRLPADLTASLGAIGVEIVVSIYKVSD